VRASLGGAAAELEIGFEENGGKFELLEVALLFVEERNTELDEPSGAVLVGFELVGEDTI